MCGTDVEYGGTSRVSEYNEECATVRDIGPPRYLPTPAGTDAAYGATPEELGDDTKVTWASRGVL
eukprot:1066812-Rhodomonas_salina.1